MVLLAAHFGAQANICYPVCKSAANSDTKYQCLGRFAADLGARPPKKLGINTIAIKTFLSSHSFVRYFIRI